MKRGRRWPGCVLAEFDTMDALRVGLDRVRRAGYHTLETYTPFDAPRATVALGLRRSRLPLVVLIAGIVGAILSYGIQWYADTYDYPLNVGGRPVHPVPAFIPATFEGTVLFAALAAFFGFVVLARLPALWHPVFEIDGFERATVDRFWLEVGGLQSRADVASAHDVLVASGALRVVPLGQQEAR